MYLEWTIPEWINTVTTTLWVLLGLDIFIALYWMNFMWKNRECRETLFKFTDSREAKNKPLPGQSVVSCCCVVLNTPKKCSCCGTIMNKIEEITSSIYIRFKRCMGLPSKKSDLDDVNYQYSYYTDIIDEDIKSEDIQFGHKAFFWPKEKPKYTFTPKKRITFTLAIMYAPILALLVDFVCDIQYLNQIAKMTSPDKNLLDKHIHVDLSALVIVAIWDVLSFFTIPVTCSIVYKMSFTSNLKANLMAEVLIINVSYLLEDGVELMMQYFYFDKYGGARYDYLETNGIANIFMSSMISFTLAVFNIFALSHLFVQEIDSSNSR